MTRLILHVGTPKTGTTSLQFFLKENRPQLNKGRVDYPVFSDGSSNNGNIWTLFIHGKYPINNEDVSILDDSIQRYDTVILSNEGFWGAKGSVEKNSFEENEVLFWQSCKDYFMEHGIDAFTIVVYLRRQDYYLSSGWKQWVKVGYASGSIQEITNDQYFERTTDYSARVELLEQIFGKENIRVALYGETPFEGGNIYRDFFHRCQLDWEETYSIKQKKENESLTYDVSEAIRRFVSKYRYENEFFHSFLYFMAFRLSRKYPEKKGMNLFDYSQQLSIYEKHREGNRRIAQNYFGKDQLFLQPKEDGLVWEPNEQQIKKYYAIFVAQYRLWRIPFIKAAIVGVRKALKK